MKRRASEATVMVFCKAAVEKANRYTPCGN